MSRSSDFAASCPVFTMPWGIVILTSSTAASAAAFSYFLWILASGEYPRGNMLYTLFLFHSAPQMDQKRTMKELYTIGLCKARNGQNMKRRPVKGRPCLKSQNVPKNPGSTKGNEYNHVCSDYSLDECFKAYEMPGGQNHADCQSYDNTSHEPNPFFRQ